MTSRTIAKSLAAQLTTIQWQNGYESPKVYLDTISQDIDFRNVPHIVVSPKGSSGLWKSQPQHQIDVLLILDSSQFHSNPAVAETSPDNVQVYGAGSLLDELTQELISKIKQALPGAILSGIDVEFSLTTLPIQFSTISLTYVENPAYGDFCKDITY